MIKAMVRLVGTLCLLIPAGLMAAPSQQGPPPLVQVAPVTLQKASKPEKYIGHVEAIESVKLQARVEGYLQEIHFQEGSKVKAGQLLYVIEQPPYEARVASAKARVTQAQADLFQAKRRLQRLKAAQTESVPKTEMDDAKAARDRAAGKLQEAQANLELAQIDLDYTTVTAPIRGRIGDSPYEKGDLVGPSSQPLAEIRRIDPIRVVFSVAESQADMIQRAYQDAQQPVAKRDLQVKLQFTNGKVYGHAGRIDFLDNNIDKQTGTLAVWARFANPKGRLVPGEYVKVFVQATESKVMPAVPQVAVQRDKDGAFVYVVGPESKVEKRRIEVGTRIMDQIIVKAGLEKGEKVVVQGLLKVRPGAPVKAQLVEKEAN